MAVNTFEIATNESHVYWAERDEGIIRIHRTERSPEGSDEVLLQWDVAVLRNLLQWGEQDDGVSSSITGVLARQVRQHSSELGLTPEMFVWHAVKVFIEAGDAS